MSGLIAAIAIVGFVPSGASAAERTSSNGARGKQIVDREGAVWTLEGTRTLRNGIWVVGGRGDEYLYQNGTLYVINARGLWKWHGAGWTFLGSDVAAAQKRVANEETTSTRTTSVSGMSGSATDARENTVTVTYTAASTGETITVSRDSATNLRELGTTTSIARSGSTQSQTSSATSSVTARSTLSTPAAKAYGNGLRSVVTTGSISGGSDKLNVASVSGFEVGDWVIVEIGKESGQGKRGTRGVGGTWPSKSYATEDQLLSDKGQPNRLFAWAEDTGYVFWWLDGEWCNMAPNRRNTFYTGQYYLGKAVPRSLQARITRIEGRTLTLDKSAAVSADDANVYLDAAPILTSMIAGSDKLSLPAGSFATGGVVWIKDKSSFELSGEGKDQTTIYSPKGVPSAMIQAYNAPKTRVRDITLQGNFRDEGFGLNWPGSTAPGTNQPVTDFDVPQGAGFPRGILLHVGSHDSEVKDVRVIDVAQQAVGVSFADNVWARRVENIQNDLMRQYVQWQYQWADTTGGGCEDCEVRSAYVISGFEAFKSANVQFIRPKGVNAMFAMNGSGGWLIVDADLRFTPNSLHPESDRYSASPWHPVININTNIGVTSQVALGGTIRNVTIIQAGYLNANNDSLKGIVINDKNPDIRIESSAFYSPDFKSPTVSNGALGLDSTGPSTTVNGMLVVGKPQPGRANIFVQKGSGQNCSGEVVEGCSRGSHSNPKISAFLAGDSAGW